MAGVWVPLGEMPNPALEAAEKAERTRRPLTWTLKDDELAGAAEEGAKVKEAWKHSHVSMCVTPVSSMKSVCAYVHVCMRVISRSFVGLTVTSTSNRSRGWGVGSSKSHPFNGRSGREPHGHRVYFGDLGLMVPLFSAHRNKKRK